MAYNRTDLKEYQAIADGQRPVNGSVPPTQESFCKPQEEVSQRRGETAQQMANQTVLGFAVDARPNGPRGPSGKGAPVGVPRPFFIAAGRKPGQLV
jgi:hypothetical protein